MGKAQNQPQPSLRCSVQSLHGHTNIDHQWNRHIFRKTQFLKRNPGRKADFLRPRPWGWNLSSIPEEEHGQAEGTVSRSKAAFGSFPTQAVLRLSLWQGLCALWQLQEHTCQVISAPSSYFAVLSWTAISGVTVKPGSPFPLKKN